MGEKTLIAWADHTFNPWIGCTKISPACDNCYAEKWSARFDGAGTHWGTGKARRRTSAQNWNLPLRWNRLAGISLNAWEGFKKQYPDLTDADLVAKGFQKPRRPRVFCASLADVFDNEAPFAARSDLFELIRTTPHLDWLLLTKRIGNAADMIDYAIGVEDGCSDHGWPWPNVWLGVTVCNQAEADRDIPKLLKIPAAVRFVSVEPMLGPIDLRHLSAGTENEIDALAPWMWEQEVENWRGTSENWEDDFEDYYNITLARAVGPTYSKIDWVIVGGESGRNARPLHPEWVRSLRDQCAGANVPFFFKQWGEWRPPREGEEYNTSLGGAQRVPAFIVAPTGAMHCFKTVEAKDSGRVMLRVGAKASGRTLDGVLHQQVLESRHE